MCICHRRPIGYIHFISGVCERPTIRNPFAPVVPEPDSSQRLDSTNNTNSAAPQLSSLQHMAGARSPPAKDRRRLFECSPTKKGAETPFTELLCCSFEFVCILVFHCILHNCFLLSYASSNPGCHSLCLQRSYLQ